MGILYNINAMAYYSLTIRERTPCPIQQIFFMTNTTITAKIILITHKAQPKTGILSHKSHPIPRTSAIGIFYLIYRSFCDSLFWYCSTIHSFFITQRNVYADHFHTYVRRPTWQLVQPGPE